MTTIGIKNGRLNVCPDSPNCVSSETSDKQHSIEAIAFSGTQTQAKKQLLSAINNMKRSNVIVSDDNYIHVEFTTALMRFVDDIEFYFPETKNEKTTIQVRSASRVGKSDFGVNRKRVEQFRSLLE